MPRATPLPADERRARLVQATVPLLQQHGRDVSTRQIAAAAGVAEGTIFRVFPSKEALIEAVIDDAFDVTPTCDALAAVSRDLDLTARLTRAVEVLQERLRQVFALFHALRLSQHPPERHQDHLARQRADNARLTAALAQVLRPDADRLRMEVAEAADLVRVLTFALSHPILNDGRCDPAARIADVVLHGVARPQPEGPPC